MIVDCWRVDTIFNCITFHINELIVHFVTISKDIEQNVVRRAGILKCCAVFSMRQAAHCSECVVSESFGGDTVSTCMHIYDIYAHAQLIYICGSLFTLTNEAYTI